MNRKSLLSAAVALAIAGPAAADMRPLSIAELDQITAGTDGEEGGSAGHATGGVLVANNSSALIDEVATVDLGGTAQTDARGVNIVNAARSLVANGVNVWDGQFAAGEYDVELDVSQSNLIDQGQATRSATVVGYARDANSIENSTAYSRTLNEDTVDLVSDVHVDTSHQVLGQSVNVGLGVGVAGRVGIELGEAAIGFDLTATSTIETLVDVNGTINLPRPFGPMQANGTLDSTITNSGSASFNVTTPTLSLDAIGSVCYTKLGICDASADDNSVYITDSETDETFDLDTEGALSIAGAEAEYLVIDEASLELTVDNGVFLASGAQENIRAVNAVNAVGSLVANGVNVSRTVFDGGVADPLDLSQRNIVVQRH